MQVMQAEGDANGGAPAASKPRVERGEVLPEADVFSASEIGQVLRYLYRSDLVGECVGCDLATVAYFGRDSDVGPLALLPIDSQFESARMLARRWARSRSSKSLSNFVAALPRDVSKPFVCIESRFADVATEMLTLSIEAKSRIDAKMARANELALSLICLELKNERGTRMHLRSDAAAAGELADDAEMNRIDSELRSIAPQQCRRLECTTSSSQAVDDILKVLGYEVTGRDPIDCHALAFLGRSTPAGPLAYLPQARQFEAACSLVRHMVHKSGLLKQYIEQHKGKYHRRVRRDANIHNIATNLLIMASESRAARDTNLKRRDYLELQLAALSARAMPAAQERDAVLRLECELGILDKIKRYGECRVAPGGTSDEVAERCSNHLLPARASGNELAPQGGGGTGAHSSGGAAGGGDVVAESLPSAGDADDAGPRANEVLSADDRLCVAAPVRRRVHFGNSEEELITQEPEVKLESAGGEGGGGEGEGGGGGGGGGSVHEEEFAEGSRGGKAAMNQEGGEAEKRGRGRPPGSRHHLAILRQGVDERQPTIQGLWQAMKSRKRKVMDGKGRRGAGSRGSEQVMSAWVADAIVIDDDDVGMGHCEEKVIINGPGAGSSKRMCRRESEDNGASDECEICLAEGRRMCIVPCGHKALCLDCGGKEEFRGGGKRPLSLCPLCQTEMCEPYVVEAGEWERMGNRVFNP